MAQVAIQGKAVEVVQDIEGRPYVRITDREGYAFVYLDRDLTAKLISKLAMTAEYAEMKRTPGKIGIDVQAIGTKWNIGTLGSEREIALVLDVVEDDDKRSIRTANAQHIVKCWNACEGIDPEAVPMLLAACIRAQANDDGSDPITTNVLNGAINRALGNKVMAGIQAATT